MKEEVKTLVAEKLRHEIKGIKIANRRAKYEERAYSATQMRAHVLPFTAAIDPNSVRMAINTISEWVRIDPDRTIEIVFNSPGGYVFDGLGFYDYLQTVRKRETQVVTRALGYTASMAGVLLQAGDIRVISPNSYLMIHEAGSGMWGKTSEMRDEVELMDSMETKCFDILAERSVLSAKKIREKCKRRDWWLDADEALKLGFVDFIE